MILTIKQGKNNNIKYAVMCSEYRLELIKTALECLYKESYHNGLQRILTEEKVRQAMKLYNEIDRLGIETGFDRFRKEHNKTRISVYGI